MILLTIHHHLSSLRNPKPVPSFGTEADIDPKWRPTSPFGIEQYHVWHLAITLPKDQTSETVFRKEYQQLRERYNSYLKHTQMVQSVSRKWQLLHFILKTVITPELSDYETGPLFFNAELKGRLLPLKKFSTLTKTNKKFIIYTDSFSAALSLQGKTFRTKNIKRFYNLLKKLPPQIQIIIAWIPSHVSITRNEIAGKLAKAALTSSLAGRSHVLLVGPQT